MLRRVVVPALAAAFIWIWPSAGVAQEAESMEDEGPPMLMISSWKCDFGNMGDVSDEWNTYGINAANAAVDSGNWWEAGVFYHEWADEWNVNYWAVGKDIPALLAGQEAANAVYDEQYPDAPNLWDLCAEHKDGFYQLGMGTDSAEEMDDGPGPMMAISAWKCTDVGAVARGWRDYVRVKAQAVVDAGTWNDAGVFYHAWASEWNVNFYYMADDIPGILAGWEDFIASMDDSAPNLTDYCTEHKDGFYSFSTTAQGTGD